MDDASGFGTLGYSSQDPLDFFGSNDEAYIDRDGLLHGLPPFEALNNGVVVCPSPLHDSCFYVYTEECWGGFIDGLMAGLSSAAEDDHGSFDSNALARAESIVNTPPHKTAFDEGLVDIPNRLFEACGIEINETLLLIGNSGYFEVWRKPAFEEMRECLDILSILSHGLQSDA